MTTANSQNSESDSSVEPAGLATDNNETVLRADENGEINISLMVLNASEPNTIFRWTANRGLLEREEEKIWHLWNDR